MAEKESRCCSGTDQIKRLWWDLKREISLRRQCSKARTGGFAVQYVL